MLFASRSLALLRRVCIFRKELSIFIYVVYREHIMKPPAIQPIQTQYNLVNTNTIGPSGIVPINGVTCMYLRRRGGFRMCSPYQCSYGREYTVFAIL